MLAPMRRPLSTLLLLICFVAASFSADSPLTSSKRMDVSEKLSLAYLPDGGDETALDLYIPQGAADTPLLVFIHGGAWVSGDKADYKRLAREFASRGFFTACVNYRLSTKAGRKHPLHTYDVAAACKWLAFRSNEFGYSPKKTFLMGHSAGAFIAALLALDPVYLGGEKSPVKILGVLGLEGIYDIPALVKRWPQYEAQFVGRAFGSEPAAWEAASPQGKIRPVPTAWFIAHSPQDELVDLGQSEKFHQALLKIKSESRYFSKMTKRHFDVVLGIGDPGYALPNEIENFMRWRLLNDKNY